MEDREGKELTNENCTPQFSKLESISTAFRGVEKKAWISVMKLRSPGQQGQFMPGIVTIPPPVPGNSAIPSSCESKEATFQVPKPQPQGS